MRALLPVLAFCSIVLASLSQRTNHVTHEERTVPIGWVKSRRADADHNIPLRIGMKQQNLHMLEDLLMNVAHPESSAYGKHWTPKEVVDYFAPSELTVDAIRTWLRGSDIAEDKLRHSLNKGWIELNVTVNTAERLLNTEYHIYEHPSGAKQIGCLSYSVPEHISDHVEIIESTSHLNRVRENPARMRKRTNLDQTHGLQTTFSLLNCDLQLTPECIRALYDFYYTPNATAKNSYGIVEFTPQAYLASDLDLFFKKFSPTQVGQRPILVSIDGGLVQTASQKYKVNAESDLDLEYAMALTNPQPITLLQTGDIVEGGDFNDWLDAVDGSFCMPGGVDGYPDNQPGGYNKSDCGTVKPPFVISISYGQDEGTANHRRAHRQCTEYGKLGLMGTTVLYSSGDFGVAGNNNTCQNSSGVNDPGHSISAIRFNPEFPASCPYVLAVGATQINSGATVNDPESASERFIYSGGGFSDIFPMPSYQKAAVTKFLKEHPPPYSAAQFNNSGMARGFPDLSANGANHVIAVDGLFELVYGTSASSPVVGSMIAMINDARLAVGKGSVGFVHPAIYSPKFAHAFNDITSGKNPGCGTDGFPAVKGWDPVTGRGTPKFSKLLHLFLELP